MTDRYRIRPTDTLPQLAKLLDAANERIAELQGYILSLEVNLERKTDHLVAALDKERGSQLAEQEETIQRLRKALMSARGYVVVRMERAELAREYGSVVHRDMLRLIDLALEPNRKEGK